MCYENSQFVHLLSLVCISCVATMYRLRRQGVPLRRERVYLASLESICCVAGIVGNTSDTVSSRYLVVVMLQAGGVP